MTDESKYKSRVLTEYSLNHPNNKKGCVFYFKETHSICILDTPYRKGDLFWNVPNVHKCEIESSKVKDNQIAWGFPAYLFALENVSIPSDAKKEFEEFIRHNTEYYQTYQTLLEDWQKTLHSLLNYTSDSHLYDFFSGHKLKRVGECIKEIIRPSTRTIVLDDLLNIHNSKRIQLKGSDTILYTDLVPAGTNTGEKEELFSQLVLTTDGDYISQIQAARTHTRGAMGFIAALIDCALQEEIFSRWEKWSFVNPKLIDWLYQSMHVDISDDFICPLIRLEDISFSFSFNYVDFIKRYLELTTPIVQKGVMHDIEYPLDFAEGNTVYSYILYSEKLAYQVFKVNQLYASFTRYQQQQLDKYFMRFMEYLQKTYNASEDTIKKMMLREYGTIQPLQISLNINTQITDKDGNDVTLERMRESGWQISTPDSNSKEEAHWSLYQKGVPEETKRDFEDFLRKLCHSKKKSMTADIKTYLKAKEDQGIIIRPKQINAEIEIVKLFGYPYKEKAYYNG